MNANDIRHYPGRMRSILQTTPGAREYSRLLVLSLALLLFLVILVSVGLFAFLQLGDYGARQVSRRFYVIVIVWLFISFLLDLVAVQLSLALSERVAGPLKRMERLLDRALENPDVVIVLREKDVLFGLARKINALLAARKKTTI